MSSEQTQQTADDPSDDRYWRNVLPSEILQPDDMMRTMAGLWLRTTVPGRFAREGYGRTYRRRIEPPQPSDSEPETMEDLRRRLDAAVRQNVELADELANEQNKKGAYKAILKRTMERAREAEALVAEAERSGQQVNAELQQLREQLATSQHLAEMSRRQVADEVGKVEQLMELVQTLTLERDRLQSSLRDHYRDGHQRATVALQSWLRPVLELVAEHPDDCGPLAVSVLGYLPSIAARLAEE